MIWTSKWRWPSMRWPASRTAANASGRRSSSASIRFALGRRIAGPVEAGAELAGERAELVVGAALHLGLERADVGDDRLEELELAAFAGVEELLEDAHDGGQSTGAPRGL